MPGSASEGAGQPGGRSVGLVVNSYERTDRDVLRPGFFPGVAAQNGRDFDEVVALVNNVADRRDATARAEELVRTGEISVYAFVADLLPAALHSARLSARALRRLPYLLDYGLVMPHVVGTRWLLGWDAETRLPVPTDWVSPSLDLLAEHPRVFHVSLGWTVGPGEPGPLGEAVDHLGDYALGWGFSDQLFLVRRADLVGPIWQVVRAGRGRPARPAPLHVRVPRRGAPALGTPPPGDVDDRPLRDQRPVPRRRGPEWAVMA